jgi:hypothetical protein
MPLEARVWQAQTRNYSAQKHTKAPPAVAPSPPKKSPCVEHFAKPENLESPVASRSRGGAAGTKSGEGARKEATLGATFIVLFMAVLAAAVWLFVSHSFSDKMLPAGAHDAKVLNSTPVPEPVSNPRRVENPITQPVITQPAISQPVPGLKPQEPSIGRLRWKADIQKRLEENEAKMAKLKERFNRGVGPGYYTEVYNEEVKAAEKEREELQSEITQFNAGGDAPSAYNEK